MPEDRLALKWRSAGTLYLELLPSPPPLTSYSPALTMVSWFDVRIQLTHARCREYEVHSHLEPIQDHPKVKIRA